MHCVTIKRVSETEDGTFGVIFDGTVPFALTLEDEWNDNAVGVSCIPLGSYTCKRRRYNKGGYDTFEVTDVADRTHILFHRGNTEDDTEGCILIAEEFGELNKKTAIKSSGKGFAEFMGRLHGADEFILHIKDYTL